jgi:hypothetical protein
LEEYDLSTTPPTGTFKCMETYKYCSDYRGGVQFFCENYINPFNEAGDKLDISFKCKYENSRCQKVPKECTEANGNPVLCSLISPNIQDHNVKYCTYIGNSCEKHFKTCESYDGSDTPTCGDIIPENLLALRYENADNLPCPDNIIHKAVKSNNEIVNGVENTDENKTKNRLSRLFGF